MADVDDWEQRALLIATRLSDAADELRELICALRADPYTSAGRKLEEEGPDDRNQSGSRDAGDR